jgi:general secretion pathway protein H
VTPVGGRAGFTLAEMVVVLVVLGIAAVAVVPAVRPAAEPDDAAAGAARVAQALRALRGEALREGSTVTAVLDPAGGHLWRVDASGAAARPLDLPTGAAIEAHSERITFRFHADGRVEGPPLRVRAGGRDVVLEYDRWTGRLR